MIYLKSVLMGVAALVASLILFVAISVLPVLAQWRNSGSGGFGFAVDMGPIFWIVAALIFAAGFWWEFRRASQ